MRMRFLAATLVLLAFPLTAQAHTTTIEPSESHWPYQQWVDEAKVPTPNISLRVVEDNTICGALACTMPGAYTIWTSPAPFTTGREVRENFRHELGHNFDYYVMSDWVRVRFGELIGDPRAWDEAPNAPKEKFAEAYRWCALTPRIKKPPNSWGYRYRPTPRLHQAVCKLLREVGHGAGISR